MKARSWLWGLSALAIVVLAAWGVSSQEPTGAYDFLDKTGVVIGWLLSCLTVLFGVTAWVERAALRRWLFGRQFARVGESVEDWERRVEALIIPVSPHRAQPEWLIRHLKPSHVSFLYTEASRAVAAELAGEFGSETLEFSPTHHQILAGAQEIENPNDPNEVRRRTREFLERFQWLSISPGKIFVDTTAGKVPTSIGAFQAAEEVGVASIYLVGTIDGKIVDPTNREHGQPKYLSDPLASPAGRKFSRSPN